MNRRLRAAWWALLGRSVMFNMKLEVNGSLNILGKEKHMLISQNTINGCNATTVNGVPCLEFAGWSKEKPVS